MIVYLYDGDFMFCDKLEVGRDGLIADGYRFVPLNEIVRIVSR